MVGWYLTETLKGAGIAASIGFGIVITFNLLMSKRFNKRLQQSGISDIDQMSGRQFEEYLGTLFGNQGYSVSYTSTTGDFGADLILKKGQEVIVIQAKRYKQSIGVKAVQEVISAMKMYNATASWVVTNSTYTKQALTLAKRNHVRMIEREELIRMSIVMMENLVVPVMKPE